MRLQTKTPSVCLFVRTTIHTSTRGPIHVEIVAVAIRVSFTTGRCRRAVGAAAWAEEVVCGVQVVWGGEAGVQPRAKYFYCNMPRRDWLGLGPNLHDAAILDDHARDREGDVLRRLAGDGIETSVRLFGRAYLYYRGRYLYLVLEDETGVAMHQQGARAGVSACGYYVRLAVIHVGLAAREGHCGRTKKLWGAFGGLISASCNWRVSSLCHTMVTAHLKQADQEQRP